MIDKDRRKRLAFHLRHLSVGLITNDEFEDNIIDEVTFGWLPEQYYRAKEAKNDDLIIQPMLELSWSLYSDLKKHKLAGKYKLSDKQFKDIARFILFLQSDNAYEWPYIDPTNPLIKFSFKDLILSVLTLGQHYRNKLADRKKELEEIQPIGDFEYWPFINKQQYDIQLKCQPFLAGRKAELT